MSATNVNWVCVTGASGFIGSYVVRDLLARHFHVHAGVIDKDSSVETRHLLDLPGASPDNLMFFNLDLNDKEGLERAVRGCQYVIHMASPTRTESVSNVEEEVIRPARDGTINLLSACERVGNVKRVVFTSCITTMIYNNRRGEDFDLQDDMWSDENFLRENKKWYQLSKTLAEKAAWQFMEKGDRSFELVCIHPGLTLGPILSPSMPFSLDHIRSLIEGELGQMEDKGIAISDVRDVAQAHLSLLERPGPLQRRYVCVSHVVSAQDFLNVIREAKKEAQVPEVIQRPNYGFLKKVEDHKLQDIGIHFTEWKNSIRDTIHSFDEHSLL
eukprot:gb/GECH01007169.1/.p1 GENE.gb/GECH01007169.1/~~gb/GECH01007169.1/.p1  ORF type:complete len:328 (+),score=72.24 gb/GECH01007169.1/:1-984(+)